MSVQMRLLSLAGALCVATLAAWSIPTLYGDTGLINVPTAEVVQPYEFDFSVAYARMLGDVDETTVLPLRLTFGISPDTEVFAVYAATMTNDAADFEILGGGIKWALSHEDVLAMRPGLAFGVRALSDVNDSNFTEAYGVVTKTVFARGDWRGDEGYAFRAHAGVAYTRYDTPSDATFISPFVGVEYLSSTGNTLVVDAIAEQEDDDVLYRQGTISASIRRPLSNEFNLELGYTRPYGEAESGNRLYVNFNYHFGDNASY